MMRALAAGLLAALLSACAAAPPAPSPIDTTLGGFVQRGELVGVSALVYQQGRETYFGAFGQADREAGRPMARDTLVQVWSMTKPVTGVAFMMLVEEGKLSLDDTLARHAPQFAQMKVYAGVDAQGQARYEPPVRPITLRDVVTHTAGFSPGFSDDTPVGEAMRRLGPGDWSHSLQDMADKLASLPLRHQPGTAWRYGISVDLQAYLVEKVSGQKFDAFLQQRIFGPLKMTHTRMRLREADADRAQMAAMYRRGDDARFTRVPDAETLSYHQRDWPLTRGSSGLLSTLDDYQRFARMLLNGGELDGARLLKPASVRLMTTDHLPPGLTDRSWLPGKGQVGFGVDVAVRLRPPAAADEASGEVGEFFWDGGANTLFWVDPKNELVAVLFTQYLPFGSVPLHKAFRDAVYTATPSARAPSQ